MNAIRMLPFLLLCTVAPSALAAPVGAAIGKLLPSPACAEGWVMDAQPALFDKDTLFDRINGESELFFPYGFEVLAYARYESSRNPMIAIDMDLYQAGSPLDAFGLFSIFRRKDDAEVTIGGGGTISASQVFFYQDRYFVRLQVTGALSTDQEVLRSCAKALSRNLPLPGVRPRELDALAVAGVVPRSERYVAQSVLGYEFFKSGLVADAVVKGEPVQVFLLTEGSSEAARRTLDAYGAYLKTSGNKPLRTGNTERSSLAGVDPLYGSVAAEQSGPLIVGAVRIKDPSAAKQLIEQILRRAGQGKGP